MTAHVPQTNSSPASPVVCQRVEPAWRRHALGMLLTGIPSDAEPAIDQFLRYAREHDLSLEELWIGQRGRRLLASVLIVPNAGRTGMLFLSPTAQGESSQVTTELIAAACRGLDPGRMTLVQALLDPPQRNEQKAVRAAGFQPLAELLYMQRDTRLGPAPLTLNDSLTVSHFSDGTHELFARAILASYEDTQDCPGLLGIRPIEDVIAGHRHVGMFQPFLWYVLHRGDEPAAVMLLNLVPQRQALELVYLGVAQAWRGQGLARQLVRHAIGLASQYTASTIVLAVDQNNTPALRLYRSLQFATHARKHAMIFTLSSST